MLDCKRLPVLINPPVHLQASKPTGKRSTHPVFHSLKMKLSLIALAALFTASCGYSTPRTASFRARPDSTEAGSLEGPFSGRVVDAASGDPVPGALVYATWSYQAGYGVSQATGHREQVVSTDTNGRYAIKAVNSRKSEGRLANFHLVIYKRGYVGYRSDRRFTDFGPRLDFAQLHNQVVLERWHSDLSHVRHLRYVGGGAAISALTSWEADEASLELSGEGRAPKLSSDFLSSLADDRLIAAQLLGEAEIKEITGFDGSFETGPLNDEADTDSYSSQHFKALGQPEIYDVAVRLWKLTPEGAQKRFAELLGSLPGVTEKTEVADRSLVAVEGDIQGYAFMDGRRATVVLITCGKGQCSELEQLTALAHKVFSNIEAVIPLQTEASSKP